MRPALQDMARGFAGAPGGDHSDAAVLRRLALSMAVLLGLLAVDVRAAMAGDTIAQATPVQARYARLVDASLYSGLSLSSLRRMLAVGRLTISGFNGTGMPRCVLYWDAGVGRLCFGCLGRRAGRIPVSDRGTGGLSQSLSQFEFAGSTTSL